MKEKLPIYEITISEELGIYAVALVKYPAMESTWQAFAEDKAPLKFSVTDEEEQKVLAVLCRADFPIYRIGEHGEEFYVIFRKDTIEEMTRKMLRDGFHESINVEHDDDFYISGVELSQIFIKNSAKGISPIGFEDIEEGSAFVEYKITDPAVWEAVKKGVFTGVSLEGVFDLNKIAASIQKTQAADDIQSLLEQRV